MSGHGRVIGGEFFDCMLYADDLGLVSHSVCVLQKMIDICVDELNCIGLSFNVKNCCLYALDLDICASLNHLHRTTTSLHMCIRLDTLELHCVQVNVLVWICVQQNPISILVLTAYFTVLLVIRMNLLPCI